MELTADLVTAIKDAVHQNLQVQIELTQKLIRLGGQRGEESVIQEEIMSQYEKRGYATRRLVMDKKQLSMHQAAGKFSAKHSAAPVIIGVHEPTPECTSTSPRNSRTLLLNGHIDIVPVGPEDMWTYPPYSGTIEGDWIYGRGGGDMRAGLLANLFALDAIRKIGKQPASRVILESVPEEESTGNGTLAAYLAGFTADAVIIPEPSNEALVRANVGVLWFQIEVKGKPVHVHQMAEGSNAISSAWKLANALKELEKTMNEQKNGIRYFEHLEHPINLNVAMIEGGDWASSVPAWCRVDCRVALYPGITAESVAADIEKVIHDAAQKDAFLTRNPPQVIWNGFFAEGYVLEPGSEAEELLHTVHHLTSQKSLACITLPAYLDARIFSLLDKVPVLVFGPISEDIHGIDERVSISSIERVTTSIALFIAAWCGLEDTFSTT
ncbi:acetylornithine deacetylase [Aspergillus heterothallicus]